MDLMRHNYMRKLDDMIRRGLVPTDILLSDVFVRHDDWCPVLNGGEWCTCEPDIEVRPRKRAGDNN